MNRLFRTTVVEISGVRTIAGGGTNASDAGQALLNLSGVSITGNQTISGVKSFVSRPTVNGTGVLLSGEAAQVDLSNYATVTNLSSTGSTLQGQINSLSGVAVQSNGTITRMIRLTQAQYNALSPKDSTTFYVIVG
jgi:hypothetical protein